MPRKNGNRQFQPSEQAAALGLESHGLGLSICKRVAQNLHGDLVYVQSPIGGCRFDLKLRIKVIEQDLFN